MMILLVVGLAVTVNAKPLGSPVRDDIDVIATEVMHSYNLKGLSLAVVEGDQLIYSQGYGLADPSGRPVSASTLLTIGSLSKSFTALAIMQLVEQGALSLDQPVVTYLPWFHTRNKSLSNEITIRHLLNQTSGFSNSLGLQPVYDRQPAYTLEQRLALLSDFVLPRQPGGQFEYSNMNYILLGAVIETVSGQDYADYLQAHIFTPLRMTDTTARLAEARSDHMATGSYWWFGLPIFSETPWYQDSVPAGYIISSAEDMGHYLVAQLNDGVYQGRSVLSADGILAMHSPGVATGVGQSYGMGWVIGKKAGIDTVSHEGDAAGYSASVILDPAGKIGVIVLANSSSMLLSPAGDLATRIFETLHGQPATRPGLTTTKLYPGLDALVLGLTVWMVLAYALLPRWWKRLAEWRRKGAGTRFTRIFLPIALDLLWPYILLGFLPQGAGFPMWRVMNVFQPDLSFWVQGLAWAAVIKGIIKLMLFLIFIRAYRTHSNLRR